ncbi:hypothetical protein [Azohydromonas australica]|uniref:hypothetical protein n=1 Tax=Azohydromonas australica TaxID=364039 RepID=UPI0012EB0964|nr:hypothetical protein [Azohydromonas australica]
MDDLRRKGALPLDFTKWDHCVREKGITSKNVQDVIKLYSHEPTIDKALETFHKGLTILNADSGSVVTLARSFKRHYQQVSFERSLRQISTNKTVSEAVNTILDQPDSEAIINAGLNTFLNAVLRIIPEEKKNDFPDPQILKTAIIYEFSKQF